MLTVWIPLVDTNAENGCLWVIPRVHTGGIAPHRPAEGKAYLEIVEQDLPPGDRICCPVPKGGALLLTNRTPHGSYENTTDIVRWSMDLRYQSAALPTNAKISRLPGEVGAAGPHDGRSGLRAGRLPSAGGRFPRPQPHASRRDLADRRAVRRVADRHMPTPVSDRWGKWWAGEANNPGRE